MKRHRFQDDAVYIGISCHKIPSFFNHPGGKSHPRCHKRAGDWYRSSRKDSLYQESTALIWNICKLVLELKAWSIVKHARIDSR
jgi:hypothetical protein